MMFEQRKTIVLVLYLLALHDLDDERGGAFSKIERRRWISVLAETCIVSL